jgi:four helix bundle protein
MYRTNFENLRVYQLAEEEIVLKWNPLARRVVGEQLADAADSIGVNIAEGSGRGSVADNRRMVLIARGSLYETKHWLRRAYRRRLLSPVETNRLKTLIDELTKTLNGYLRLLEFKL